MSNRQVLPVIDIGPFVDPKASSRAKQQCANHIKRACVETGFFYVTGHGILDSHRQELFNAIVDFFSLPLAAKEAISLKNNEQFRGYTTMHAEITDGRPDWHECLDIQPLTSRLRDKSPSLDEHVLDDIGQWPKGLPGFPGAIMQTWDDRLHLAQALVRGFEMSLGLPTGYFGKYHGLDLCDLRLSYYPVPEYPPSDESALGMNAHVDLGFLAILDQNNTPGLEVRLHDTWHDVVPMAGAYMVTIGLMMQRWTNDKYRATWHRVRLSAEKDRYSASFFYEPKPDTIVEPLKICCGPENLPAYAPITVGEYFNQAFTKAYRETAS